MDNSTVSSKNCVQIPPRSWLKPPLPTSHSSTLLTSSFPLPRARAQIGDMIAQLQKEITAKRELMNQFALENGLAKRVAPQGGADDGADEE